MYVCMCVVCVYVCMFFVVCSLIFNVKCVCCVYIVVKCTCLPIFSFVSVCLIVLSLSLSMYTAVGVSHRSRLGRHILSQYRYRQTTWDDPNGDGVSLSIDIHIPCFCPYTHHTANATQNQTTNDIRIGMHKYKHQHNTVSQQQAHRRRV